MNKEKMTREELDKKVSEMRQKLEAELVKIPEIIRDKVRATTEAHIRDIVFRSEAKMLEEDLIALASSRGYTLEHGVVFRDDGHKTQEVFFFNWELLMSAPPALRIPVLRGWKESFSIHIDEIVERLTTVSSPSCGIPGHDHGSEE